MKTDPLDEMIVAKLKELDNIHPPHLPDRESLWQSFKQRRDSAQARIRRIQWSIASGILILAIAGYQMISLKQAKLDMFSNQYSEFAESSSEQNALEYIMKICAQKNISCNSPVVLELRADLEVSFDKLKEIDQQLLLYGDDVNLIRAKARIENHQARVIKAIVQTL